jgi:serine/threonine protein kinase
MLPPGTTVCPRDGARPVEDNPFTDEATVRRDSTSPPSGSRPSSELLSQPALVSDPRAMDEDEDPDEDSGARRWEETVSRDVLVGKQLGDFVVKRRIGAGGMGIVYEGEHPIIGRKVAIKILRPEFSDGGSARDLIAEARAASAIRHRGIIDVFGFGTIPHIGQYLVMEYLEGMPLDEVIGQRAPMLEAEVVALLDELLAALGAAHAVGVIHRDLKPGNIFVVRDSGGGEAVKVLDFGLAKRSEAPHGTSPQTRASMIVGTPEYMAPEQASGHAVGPHTDLYSVGVIAFEMLTRRLPFEGNSAMAIAIQHVQAKPPPPSTYVDLHPALDELVLRLLAKTAAQRPASAEAVRRELKVIARQLADGATRMEPSPLGDAPSDQIPSVPSERPITSGTGRPAAKSTWPSGESITVKRKDPTGPQAPAGMAGSAAPTALDMPLPMPRHAPTTEQVSPIRPSRAPQLAVAAVAVLLLGAGGLWALLREDPPPVVETPQTPVTPPPVTVKPTPPVEVKPPVPPENPQPPDETAKPPPDSTATDPLAQQGTSTAKPPGEQTAVKPSAKKGTLLLVVRGSATIILDGKPAGTIPPDNELELSAGKHKLMLVNPLSKTYEAIITIKPGATTEHQVTLQPKDSPSN